MSTDPALQDSEGQESGRSHAERQQPAGMNQQLVPPTTIAVILLAATSIGLALVVWTRRAAAQRPARSESAFRTLAETTPAAIGLFRTEVQTGTTRLLYANSAAEAITGYTQAELLDMDARDLVHPAFRNAVPDESLLRAEGHGRRPGHEIKIVTKDGDTRWVTLTINSIEFEGEPAVLATAFDITERKRAEEALKLSEDRYRIFVENINDVIFALDIQGSFTYASPVIERVTGYKVEEVVGQPFGRLVHEEDYAEVRRSFERTLAGNPDLAEFRIRAKDGSVLHVRTNCRPVLADGQPLGLTGTMTDITESKEREEQIRKLSQAVNQSPSAVIITNPDGVIEYVNPKFCQITGYTPEEVLGQNPRLLRSDDTPLSLYQELWATITAGREWQGELRNRKKNGEQYWVSVSISPIRNANGAITHYVAVQEDITERKAMEAAEREQRILAEALRDTAAALTSTLDLDEVLERILANVGRVVPHDLANIMLVEDGLSRVVRSYGFPNGEAGAIGPAQTIPIDAVPELRQMSESGQPLLVPQVPASGTSPPQARSYLGAPIRMGGETLGFINLHLTGASGQAFTEKDLDRLQAFADEAAIAIHNAQLYEQAQKTAMLEERQRLARDLHDAVSQTLFSANVIAEMLPRLWERSPEEVGKRLDQLHLLTQAALAEMRTLLLELRPAALADAELADLLRYLTDALGGRKQIAVNLTLEGQPNLPPDVKVALYRIAQEAMNNIAKHSGASEASVRLQTTPERVKLCIRDNGRGIDPARIAPDRMGLTIMRERADAIGADLELVSQPGAGTRVTVTWPGGTD